MSNKQEILDWSKHPVSKELFNILEYRKEILLDYFQTTHLMSDINLERKSLVYSAELQLINEILNLEVFEVDMRGELDADV